MFKIIHDVIDYSILKIEKKICNGNLKKSTKWLGFHKSCNHLKYSDWFVPHIVLVSWIEIPSIDPRSKVLRRMYLFRNKNNKSYIR